MVDLVPVGQPTPYLQVKGIEAHAGVLGSGDPWHREVIDTIGFVQIVAMLREFVMTASNEVTA
ncbi:hypothetical protein D5045_16715 [Verminephrobacter eiseniae]|uniref:hypothetical protein n=1 Tax=Verminephrobacter eiseniae TaxID=364317 RepID=UPI00223855E3|nr:hypothetical protein [Verminephrobacter eiseniae]MCW5261750.1 hypothetical protein [Verminephrobacter eiseniae]